MLPDLHLARPIMNWRASTRPVTGSYSFVRNVIVSGSFDRDDAVAGVVAVAGDVPGRVRDRLKPSLRS